MGSYPLRIVLFLLLAISRSLTFAGSIFSAFQVYWNSLLDADRNVEDMYKKFKLQLDDY